MRLKSSCIGGVTLVCSVMTLVLVGLKLNGRCPWPWWLVLAPGLGLLVVLALLVGFVLWVAVVAGED